MPSGRCLPLALGMYTRLTGRACGGRERGGAQLSRQFHPTPVGHYDHPVDPSRLAASVSLRDLPHAQKRVAAWLRSINFCKLRTCLRSPSFVALKILCRSRLTLSSWAEPVNGLPVADLVLWSVHFLVPQLVLRFGRLGIGTSKAHLAHVGSLSGRASARIRPVIRGDRWRGRPYCLAFLLPFGHRHLLRATLSRRGPGPSLRSAYRAVPGPRRGSHVPHGRDLTGEGALFTPRRWCSTARPTFTRPPLPPLSGAAFSPALLPISRVLDNEAFNKGLLAFTRPAFPLPVAPGRSGRPWAFALMLQTPPLPAAQVRVGRSTSTDPGAGR